MQFFQGESWGDSWSPLGSMCGIFTYIWLILMGNVGKYTSPMDPMGYKVKLMGVSSPHSQPIQVPGFGLGSLRDCKKGGGPKREGIFDEWPGKKKIAETVHQKSYPQSLTNIAKMKTYRKGKFHHLPVASFFQWFWQLICSLCSCSTEIWFFLTCRNVQQLMTPKAFHTSMVFHQTFIHKKTFPISKRKKTPLLPGLHDG